MTRARVHTAEVMDTLVSIRAVHDAGDRVLEQAFGWFAAVEAACSRFDPASEILSIAERAGEAVAVSEIVFETVRFALELARESDGAFDPTVGHRLEARGFDREYRTGARIDTRIADGESVTWRDVSIDESRRTIALARPLVIDLGAIAKGFAIDMAARELREHGVDDFAIDAGGDLYLGGRNADRDDWSVGISNPRTPNKTIETIAVSNAAVCTSGDYRRRLPGDGRHHIMDPRTGESARALASVTVVAPLAMVADGLATAAFVLGPERGVALLERHGASGVLYSPSLERFATRDAR